MPNDKDENKISEVRSKYGKPLHYYGDTVRRLFIFGAMVMIATLPLLNNRLPVSSIFSIFIIVVLSLSAGSLAPRNKWAMYFDLVVAVVAVVVFEYYAIETYKTSSLTDSLFLVDQLLAFIFLFASYNAVKTLRSL